MQKTQAGRLPFCFAASVGSGNVDSPLLLVLLFPFPFDEDVFPVGLLRAEKAPPPPPPCL